jgi:hypothetical protein
MKPTGARVEIEEGRTAALVEDVCVPTIGFTPCLSDRCAVLKMDCAFLLLKQAPIALEIGAI